LHLSGSLGQLIEHRHSLQKDTGDDNSLILTNRRTGPEDLKKSRTLNRAAVPPDEANTDLLPFTVSPQAHVCRTRDCHTTLGFQIRGNSVMKGK
jgi:hypothetical protein